MEKSKLQENQLITGATLFDPLLFSKTESAINTYAHRSTTELTFKLVFLIKTCRSNQL